MATYSEFLSSHTVALGTPHSDRTLKIHKSLLASKCQTLFTALNSRFKEGKTGVYICSETSEATLIRFIEWAYRGDYTNDLSDTEAQTATGAARPEPILRTLMSHMEIYVFAEVYAVDDLKKISYSKITTCFEKIGHPSREDEKEAVVEVLRVVFTKIPSKDPLTGFAAHYASWSINHLRMSQQFCDLLTTVPSVAARIMDNVNPCFCSPWQANSTNSTNSKNSIKPTKSTKATTPSEPSEALSPW